MRCSPHPLAWIGWHPWLVVGVWPRQRRPRRGDTGDGSGSDTSVSDSSEEEDSEGRTVAVVVNTDSGASPFGSTSRRSSLLTLVPAVATTLSPPVAGSALLLACTSAVCGWLGALASARCLLPGPD